MKCPMCDGTGKSEIGVGAFTIHGADCDQCNGKGIIEPMTNEEYIHSLNTEQLAEWISKVAIDAWFRQVNNELPKPNGAKEWAEWLKQPHND